jgi:hypothetical protein
VRLCPGSVTNIELESDGAALTITLRDRRVIREPILDRDDARRRVSWSIESQRLNFYCASLQIFEAGIGNGRAVWIADFSPHAAKDALTEYIVGHLCAMKEHLERRWPFKSAVT